MGVALDVNGRSEDGGDGGAGMGRALRENAARAFRKMSSK
jgi:hypothetical protein